MFCVPSRAELLSRFRSKQRNSKLCFTIETCIFIPALFLIQWSTLTQNPSEAFILLGVCFGPTLLSLLYTLAIKKKLVSDLREDIKFGTVSKHDLLDATSIVLEKLKIAKDNVNFYITAEKQINAYALSIGLGEIFPKKKTIFINRATVHNLTKAELITVIAHELAHLYKYPQNYHRWFIYHQLVISSVVFLVWSHIPNMFLGIVILGFLVWLIPKFTDNHSQDIEFLCDDFGSEIGGVEEALRAEYKLGLHQEQITRAYSIALDLKLKGKTVTAKDLNQIVNDSLTYDGLPLEVLEREVRSRISAKSKDNNTSFFAFMKTLFFWEDTRGGDRLSEELLEIKKLEKVEKLNLSAIKSEPLNLEWFKELRNILVNNNNQVLFRISEERNDTASTHPSHTRRILFLLENLEGSTTPLPTQSLPPDKL